LKIKLKNEKSLKSINNGSKVSTSKKASDKKTSKIIRSNTRDEKINRSTLSGPRRTNVLPPEENSYGTNINHPQNYITDESAVPLNKKPDSKVDTSVGIIETSQIIGGVD